MSTGFQWVFDNASEITMDAQPVVAQTVSRDGTVRSTSRGGSIWTFKVKFAAGMKFTDLRTGAASVAAKGRFTTDTVSLNSAFLGKYLGDSTTTTGFSFASTSGNTITMLSGGTGMSGSDKKFRAGDLIQLNKIGSNGGVYLITEDVAYNSNTVKVDRPVVETAAYFANIAHHCVFKLVCTKLPSITAFDYNLGTFNGEFEFAEDIT